MKHEHLLEGLLSAERRECEEEEAAMAGEVSRAFAEKRKSVRRLQDEEEEVRGGREGGREFLIGDVPPAT